MRVLTHCAFPWRADRSCRLLVCVALPSIKPPTVGTLDIYFVGGNGKVVPQVFVHRRRASRRRPDEPIDLREKAVDEERTRRNVRLCCWL